MVTKIFLISGKIQICPPAYWRKLESYSDWNVDPSDVWIDAWFFFMHRLAFFSFQIGTYPYLIYENPESNFRYLKQFHLNLHCFGLTFDDENDIRTPDHRQVDPYPYFAFRLSDWAQSNGGWQWQFNLVTGSILNLMKRQCVSFWFILYLCFQESQLHMYLGTHVRTSGEWILYKSTKSVSNGFNFYHQWNWNIC